jgi:hypothetical protein
MTQRERLGKCYSMSFGDQAIARYREVLSVDPLRADAYMHLGSALYSAGRLPASDG